ncbi:MAG TPA: hypothetical protein VFM54_13300 [Micromonosporaceae bacterium]|nr:hypothetical protein [Micromonosporaceae bacterium]
MSRVVGRAAVPHEPPADERGIHTRLSRALAVVDGALRVVTDVAGRDALLDVRLALTTGPGEVGC